MLITTLITFIFGAIFGSFVGAWTYRLPRKIKISKGRSFCPKCKHEIAWYDNIPLLSYLVLGGKCRNCKKNITLREPLIELGTGLLFVLIFYIASNCGSPDFSGSALCKVNDSLGYWSLPYFGLVVLFLVAIFVIDLEHQIIPDEFSFILFFLGFLLLIFTNYDNMFMRIFMGFASALFLLSLHLVTKGRGMGLGDVKLVLFTPLILGTWHVVLFWLMLSFIIGAVVGIFLILTGRAKMGAEIPFGPFLVLSFIISLIVPAHITSIIFGGII